MESPRFQHSDAWIFLSLSDLAGGTSLVDLIAKADWLNHAIPTEAEIEGAVHRLARAGLVCFSRSKFRLTDSGKALYQSLLGRGGSMLTLWKRLEKHLNQADFPVLKVKDFKLKPNELHDAFQDYNRRFWKTYARIEANEKKR